MCVNFVIFQLNAKNSWCAICDAYMKILSRLPNAVSSRKITCNAAWISMCLIHTSLSLINIVSYFLLIVFLYYFLNYVYNVTYYLQYFLFYILHNCGDDADDDQTWSQGQSL